MMVGRIPARNVIFRWPGCSYCGKRIIDALFAMEGRPVAGLSVEHPQMHHQTDFIDARYITSYPS